MENVFGCKNFGKMFWIKPTDPKHQVLRNNNLFGEQHKVVALIKIFSTT